MTYHDDIARSNNKDLQIVERQMDRRQFMTKTSLGLGAMALGSLLGADKLMAGSGPVSLDGANGLPGLPHFTPKAKRIVFLFQSGGPSQLETFDYKPRLYDLHGQDLPASVRQGQRLTGMSAEQTEFPMTIANFRQVRHHVIGNGMRLDDDSEIVLDERWRDNLSAQDIVSFDAVAGATNRRLGYL